jgi:hypothetical protein
MVIKEGGSSSPSYRKVVVDRGKGPHRGGFKVSQYGASGSTPGLHGEDTQEKKGQAGEEENVNQSKAAGPSQPMVMGGNNACKPKMKGIPLVVLEDPQTQEYRNQMRVHSLICKFMGLWPTERVLRSWIKFHWKQCGEVDLHLGSKAFSQRSL